MKILTRDSTNCADATKTFGGVFDITGKLRELAEIAKRTEEASFWDNRDESASVLKRQTQLKNVVNQVNKAGSLLDDLEVMVEMVREEETSDQDPEILTMAQDAESRILDLEMARMLSGENDRNNAYLVINAGAGGTESQDWADMLQRMYIRFCERRKWKVELADHQPGEEAGIKSVTLAVEGENAFGFLKAEIGIHRLVRISPFDSAKRRHTSFAAVFVYPEVDDDINIEIDEKDIRIDVFRASGAGGQKVNKTSSAVRVTHFPTGIVVQCQNERSQHKNKDMAMKVLKSRIYDLEQSRKNEEKEKVEASKQAINFGSQIRSYVLHPYRMVKDHRTGVEMGNTTAVLDGELDSFVQAFLMGVTKNQG